MPNLAHAGWALEPRGDERSVCGLSGSHYDDFELDAL